MVSPKTIVSVAIIKDTEGDEEAFESWVLISILGHILLPLPQAPESPMRPSSTQPLLPTDNRVSQPGHSQLGCLCQSSVCLLWDMWLAGQKEISLLSS
jgi:hypothetical protein